ncbi:MAG TPA: kelch repeat-containing protein, partial [Puia sp.]|nr:kelch repeat-containing protein [Puia sp.]
MKQNIFCRLLILLPFFLNSCAKSSLPYTEDGDWITRSQLNGPARSEAVSFTIGNYAYLGTGWDGLNNRYADFWQYDPVNDNWSQVGSMPESAARSNAVGVATDTKGYVGTGYDGFNYLQDFWEFDPSANTWVQKSNFPGGTRYEAVGFGIGSYIYVGTGFDGLNAHKDFYKYDPGEDTWNEIGFSGNKRYSAVAFVYNNKGYVVTGVNSGTAQGDFWVFDPSQQTANWTELRHIFNYSTDTYDDGYTNIERWNAAAFVIKAT